MTRPPAESPRAPDPPPVDGPDAEGPASDGGSLAEVIAAFEVEGFGGQFAARDGGRLLCYTCRREPAAETVQLYRLRRTEGASDPDDMAAVVALTCPRCGARGTVVLKYGPEAPDDDSDVLRLLVDGTHQL